MWLDRYLERGKRLVRSEQGLQLPAVEALVIANVRQNFNIPAPRVTLTEVIISGRSSAGYFCDLIYKEFDERKASLSEIKGKRIDQFRASFEADGKGPFGLHLTFYDGIAVGSEGYSYDVGLPDDLRSPKLIGDVVIDPY
jgi:hypothetical protein